MRKVLILLLLLAPSLAFAQLPNFQTFCSVGNVKPKTQGIASSFPFIASYPHCVITVYTHGTTTPLPTLFSDADGLTPLANPFTASDNSWFQFYVAAGRYDVQETDCTPTSCNLLTPFTWTDIQLNVGGGGGGSPGCGLLDVQINDPLGTFGGDCGIFQENPSTHTVTDTNVNATQQVTVSDATHSGVIIPGHSNGATVDFSLNMSVANLGANYGFDFPPAAPTGDVQALRTAGGSPVIDPDGVTRWHTQWSSNGAGVSYEDLFPLWTTGCDSPGTCIDLVSTPVTWQFSAALLGPPGPTVPSQNVVQWCTNGIASTGTLSCLLPAVLPGDVILVATRTEFGLGCSETITITDSQANAYTLLDGTNPSCFQDSYATISAGGNLTVTATYNPSSAGYSTVIYAVELSGVGAVDAHAYASTSWPSTFPAITTSHANDTIIAIGESYTTPSVGNYFAGANFGMAGQAGVQSAQGGGPFFESIGGEARNVGSTGTYTPTMTSSVATGDGNAWSVSFQTTALPHAGSYTSRFIRYFDLTAGGDFPAIASQAGNCLGADSTSTILRWITCGASGVTSIQFKNAGTNFGSPMTGTGSMNFVNCTVSGTTPAFTITCSGAGDTITSPNSTMAIGGTSSNTTLDVVGATGEVLAGATPALTRTPALGTDGSNAGTMQLANGSSSAHTIFGSAATTSNTILGPATVIPTNHIVGCTTSSTTCTLTDLGTVPSGAGSPVFKTETATYTVPGTDFSTPSTGCGKIWVGSGAASTMSVHLPSTTPAAGQCVDIWVYANSIVTIDTAGAQNVEIAGSSSGTKLGQGMGVEISTDGTNYLGQGLVLPSNDGSDTAFGQNTFISSGGGSTYFGQNINASGSGTGANNTYVGKSIGASGSGSSNTAVGYGALPSLSGGSQNTIVGLSGGFSIVGGSNNSCFGYGGCGSISSGTNNALFCGGNSSCDTPGGGTTNYLNIGQQIIGDTSKGILIFKGPTTSIASNACGSSTQGTLATGSNDMAGEVTVGTAAVTSCAVSFANTHNQAPFCTVTSQAGATVVGFGYSISTSTLTVTATSGFSSTKFDYHCFAGSTSNNPTP